MSLYAAFRYHGKALVGALVFGTILIAACSTVRAQEFQLQYKTAPPNRPFLFGEWRGLRTKLHDRGIDLSFEATNDTFWILHGGISNQEASWPRIRGTIDIDLGKLAGANGLSIHATALWQTGVDVGAKLGSFNNPSSLPSAHTFRMDSYWLQWIDSKGRVRIRAGQMAGYDFYANSEYGASYINLTQGYAFSDLNQTTYLPFNPAGTPAVEVRLQPAKPFPSLLKGVYVKSALFSGNRDQYNQDPTGLKFKMLNTGVSATELGYLMDAPDHPNDSLPEDRKVYPGLYKFGLILNNGTFTNPLTGMPAYGNHLLYAIASQAVYREQPGSLTGLDLIYGWNQSAKDIAAQNSQWMAGARYNGPIPKRPADTFAFGVVRTQAGRNASTANFLEYGVKLSHETMYEVNYRVQITPYWVLQPVFQYYASAGGQASRSSAVLVGFRAWLRL